MFEGRFVIVRGLNSGNHCGILEYQSGTEVMLKNSKNIFRWNSGPAKKIYTLNELAKYGLPETSMLSEAVDEYLVTDAIAIIPCTEDAIKTMENSRWK